MSDCVGIDSDGSYPCKSPTPEPARSCCCRWGYEHVQELAAVVANYTAAGLPLEAIWSDIDYMHIWRDFTLDHVNYSMPEMGVRTF